MIGNLKAPPPTLSMKSMLTTREIDFCDLYLMTHKLPGEIYAMSHATAFTAIECQKRAGALLADRKIKNYLEEREAQLNEWYFGKSSSSTGVIRDETPKTVEEIMAKNQSRVLEAIDGILQNTKDPNYSDVVKLHLQKMLKDIEMDRIADPPQRYLPESCLTCRYKVFVEGECTDECQRCKYKKFGEESGLYYDHKTQLENV